MIVLNKNKKQVMTDNLHPEGFLTEFPVSYDISLEMSPKWDDKASYIRLVRSVRCPEGFDIKKCKLSAKVYLRTDNGNELLRDYDLKLNYDLSANKVILTFTLKAKRKFANNTIVCFGEIIFPVKKQSNQFISSDTMNKLNKISTGAKYYSNVLRTFN